MKREKGVSVLELLIGLFLASIILTVLMQFYLNNKKQYTESQIALETWFDVQWVSDQLGDSIRKAGFTPCLGINQLTTKGLRGEHLQALRSQPQSLQISRMSELYASVRAFQSKTELLVSNGGFFKERHLLLIADCEHAEVHQILNVEQVSSGTLITLDRPLEFYYDLPTYAGEWLEEQWFIKTNEQGDNALYYKLVHSEELSPLIHSLTTRIQSKHDKQWVEAVLGWDEDKRHNLTVMVRGT